MDELEDAYLGALEAERVRRGESSTRPLDTMI
jgi:predicted DNA-binding protein